MTPTAFMSHPYLSVLRVPPFRRFWVGRLLSSLGDGMSAVGVVWLALHLATPGSAGLAVGAALAAYFIPAIPLGLVFTRTLRQLDARWLMLLDSANRCLFLGAISALVWMGSLNLVGLISLLAASSVFHAWGIAGQRSIVADLIDPPNRFAANSLLFGQLQVATVIGPGIAGILTAAYGAEIVLALDSLSFAVLFVLVLGLPAHPRPMSAAGKSVDSRSTLRALFAYPLLRWLLLLTFLFFLFYGPVETALPIQVQRNLEGGASLLGALWAAFGIGALLGGLMAGGMRRLPLKTLLLIIVAGWGISVVILGYTRHPPIALLAMGLGGFIYSPYQAIIATLLQTETQPADLARVSAAWTSVLLGATPIGILIGGPLVDAFGPEGTLLLSGVITIALALVGAWLSIWHKDNPIAPRTHDTRSG